MGGWLPSRLPREQAVAVGASAERPKKGKPADIPVPKRGDFDKLLDKAAKGTKKS